ncbi:hypothetical protein I317_06167 [Kwoniella heveanensis CBS 569]|nr:hypothetical protein I317_06167 [Kwoniella heveanensis CBS 569]
MSLNLCQIIGGGVFGGATALSLALGSYKGHADLITILDRSAEPPAADAASYDYNKIVRQEYSDPIYARLAHDAMMQWRTPEYKKNYYETGVIVSVGKTAKQSDYISKALAANAMPGMDTPGLKAYVLKTEEDVATKYPKGVPLGDFAQQHVYINEAGGWAHSRGAVVDVNLRSRELGVGFEQGEAEEFVYDAARGTKDVKGVRTKEGKIYHSDLVILAAGSWSTKLVPELGEELLPTGQVVGTIQLSQEELSRYNDVPVTRLIDNGFYIFPPNQDGIMKFAIHQKGYVNPTQGLPSFPRTTLTPGYAHQQIPPEAKEELKAGLKRVYPELADREWITSRLCWYSDRPSGDWLIDYHEKYPSLFIASGCCGHALKFLPIMGDLVVKGLEGTLPLEQKDIWAYSHRVKGRTDASRTFSKIRMLDPAVEIARL